MADNTVYRPPAQCLQSPTKPNVQNFEPAFEGSSSRSVLEDHSYHPVQYRVTGLVEKIIMDNKDSPNMDKYVKELRQSLKFEFEALSEAISEHKEMDMYAPLVR